MKILLVADLHYSLPQFDWLIAEAVHYDAVILAGDLLDVSAIASLDAQIVVMRATLDRLSALTALVVCSGNHDLDRMEDGEHVAGWLARCGDLRMCCDGASVAIGDTLISACPWWDGPRVREGIAAQLDRDAARKEAEGLRRWIWAYHAPPGGSRVSWGGTRHYGDPDLRDWIDRYGPDIVCSGHVHNAPFVPDGAWADRVGRTWCFNMGKQIGPVPAHIAIETDLGEALWFSLEGGETLHLGPGDAVPARLEKAPDWF
jgi:Icc-related predicted phosphoesterase